MAISDKKRVQTFINLLASTIEEVRGLSDLRTLWISVNPDVTGTPLDGNVGATNTLVNDLLTLANSATADTIVAAKVDSHRNKALES